eukprot:1181755-Prorocentrum_minimum.AAC.1
MADLVPHLGRVSGLLYAVLCTLKTVTGSTRTSRAEDASLRSRRQLQGIVARAGWKSRPPTTEASLDREPSSGEGRVSSSSGSEVDRRPGSADSEVDQRPGSADSAGDLFGGASSRPPPLPPSEGGLGGPRGVAPLFTPRQVQSDLPPDRPPRPETPQAPFSPGLEDWLQRNEAALNNWRAQSVDSRAVTPLPPDPSLEDRLQRDEAALNNWRAQSVDSRA